MNIYCFSYFCQSIDRILNTRQKTSTQPTIRFFGYSQDLTQQHYVSNTMILVNKLKTVLFNIKQDSFTLNTLEQQQIPSLVYYQYISNNGKQKTWEVAQQLLSKMYNIIDQGKLVYINGDSFAHCQQKYSSEEEDTNAFTWRPDPSYQDITLFPMVVCQNIMDNQQSFNTIAHELSHNAGTTDYFSLNGKERVYVDDALCEKWRDNYGNAVTSSEGFAAYCIGDFLQTFYT